ncbi:MAG: FAD binding domain-containing protein, partial [Elusimicrobiota bacterium]
MRGDSLSMRVLRPRSPREALSAYAREPKALPLAGGTDLMVLWNAGLLNGRRILDLSRLAEWKKISFTKAGARIGALVTHARLRGHPLILRHFPLLAQACAVVGASQIQNRGTLGGNIANASPAGDTFPPLAVYEARVILATAQGRRTLPLREVFAGVKKTTLAPGELIEAVELPFPPAAPRRQVFRKVGQRRAQTISKTVAAGLLWMRKDGTVSELRFALGSMAPTMRRLSAVEAFMKGKKAEVTVIEEALRQRIASSRPGAAARQLEIEERDRLMESLLRRTARFRVGRKPTR